MAFLRRHPAGATLVLFVALLGGGAYLRVRSEGRVASKGEVGGAPPALEDGAGASVSAPETFSFSTGVAQPVSGAPVVRDTLWISVTAAGEATAHRRAVMKARVEGRIAEVAVRENDRVDAGDVLLRFDTTKRGLAVVRARADLRRAEAEYRELVLFDDEITDPDVRRERERFARARSGLDQAEVALREAELNLERATVRAPFPGRVANLNVVEGEEIASGAELVTAVDMDPVEVEVRVLEAEIGRLEEGRRASVTFPAFPGETFRARAETINPVVDPGTRTARVTLSLPNPRGRIKPGMYARVALEARSFPDRLLVPRKAIVERDRRAVLFVFEPEAEGAVRGRARWRYVTTGLENDSLVEIVPSEETGTVEPGERVLVDGHHYLVHDARVRLVEDAGAEGGGAGR